MGRDKIETLFTSLAVLALCSAPGCGDATPEVEPLAVAPAAGTVTSADGVPIAYEALGEGSPVVVLVHGWSCDRGYWAAQMEPLARHHRVVAVDLGGHGDSGLGREDWTIAAFAADVAAVVEGLGLERTILVGHSMGGDVVVEAARLLPGRVAGLVWVDTYRRLGTRRELEEVEAFLAPFQAGFEEKTLAFVRTMFPPAADPALVERVAADMASAPPAVAVSALRAGLTYDREVTGRLAELDLPVVAINPAEPPSDVASLAAHGVELVSQGGVGHFPMMEGPEEFNRLLSQVITQLAERRAR